MRRTSQSEPNCVSGEPRGRQGETSDRTSHAIGTRRAGIVEMHARRIPCMVMVRGTGPNDVHLLVKENNAQRCMIGMCSLKNERPTPGQTCPQRIVCPEGACRSRYPMPGIMAQSKNTSLKILNSWFFDLGQLVTYRSPRSRITRRGADS